MAARGSRGGVGERVLESRHVIGLFMLMLLFSGVFFALGYVMGRNQYDGQVRAAMNPRATAETSVAPKPEPSARHSNAVSPVSDAPTDPSAQPSSDWGFYNSGKAAADDSLKPVSQPVSPAPLTKSKNPARNSSASSKPLSSSEIPRGSYTVQVAALRREADALTLANGLQKKKFPAFVVSPQGDKYYHVRVGPYADQKSADAAKKGLESAGFKAIVKR